MALIYRPIDPHNAEESYQFNLVHEFSLRDSWAGYTPDSEEERKLKTKRITERLLSDASNYFCLAAFDGKKMVGGLFQAELEINKAPACHIHGLWVDPGYRKQGIAKTLKTMGEAWGKERGCHFMDTNVLVTNQQMIKLNQDLGYEVARFNFRKPLI